MDNDFLKKPYAEKPIVLSPPPVNGSTQGSYQSQLANNTMSGLPINYHSQRNQSVGYNLQQEFEALKADLDLDLSLANDILASSYKLGYSGDDDEAQSILLRPDHPSGGSGSAPDVNLSNPMTGPNSAVDHASVGAGTGASHNHGLLQRPGLLSGTAYSMNLSMLENLVREGLPLGKLTSSFLPQLQAPARPQSVNDFSHSLGNLHNGQLHLNQKGFIADMMLATSWIESLSTHDMVTVMDYWCNNLPYDVLLTMKCKLENHLGNQMGHGLPHVFGITNQFSQDYSTPDYSAEARLASSDLGQNVSTLSSASVDGNGISSAGGLLQPKPKANGNFRSHLFSDPKVQRPKSADPTVNGRLAQVNGPSSAGHNGYPNQAFPSPSLRNQPLGQLAVDRARSPTTHLCEKTSFLQLAAGQSPHSFGPSSEDSLDLSAALKLGALATINSRVVLDSGRKNYAQASAGQRGGVSATASFEESLNRQAHSSSVPVGAQKYSTVAMSGRKKEGDSPGKKMGGGVLGDSYSGASSPQATNASLAAALAALAGTSMPNEIASFELLNNIPAWLKLLRLHKYTDCLKDIYWKDLVSLLDQQLEDRGVRALGARRKLLKAFEAVRQARM
ncbi:hypothetical protein PUMCH_001135 [Australozyma saopauloensis]|uniref:RNA-binding protein VTS1 n=1 Tax=Australozyma saopauloensis TaxID=291208 RepID=A0AAX4H5W2_9ASCO|nr:hypothetical protein PUMCH_001135 [[Candida] saopauloensis]